MYNLTIVLFSAFFGFLLAWAGISYTEPKFWVIFIFFVMLTILWVKQIEYD